MYVQDVVKYLVVNATYRECFPLNMRVHVRRSHAARLIRFVAYRTDERTFICVHSRVDG